MTDTSDGAAPNPRIGLLAQYLKDCSYENPNAPQSLAKDLLAPSIDVTMDVQVQPLGENRFEVALRTTATASRDTEAVFVAEVLFAGVFELFDVPEEQIQPVCLVECPRLLFPFARRVLCDLTRDGGMPPILLDPVDFGALYERRQSQQTSTDGETIN
jgi:preprotein translocase subunit SecB